MVHHAFHHEHFHEKRADDVLDNKMRFIHNLPEAAQKAAAEKGGNIVETVYSQVYVTATGPSPAPKASDGGATGNGAGAKSQLAAEQASYLSAKSQAQAPNTALPSTSAVASQSEVKGKPTQRTRTAEPSQHAGTPLQQSRTTAAASSSASLEGNAVVGSPQTRTRDPTAVAGSPLSSTNSPDSVISQKSDGMSSGAKAGLAFGIILILALAGGLLFFCWRRRKQQLKRGSQQLDEKRATQDSFFGGTTAAAARGPQRESVQSEKSFQTTRTAATAPRLSLRPVTQFLPNILGGEKTAASGNNLDVPAMSEKARSNPFDDSAALSEKPARNPFEDGDGTVFAGKTSPGHSQKSSWEGSEPPTPKSTKFGTAAAVPITAAGAPNGAQGQRGPNNVHRVQLDFKPSMEDELELRSGQLVRMLHEYDDGWVSSVLFARHDESS